MATPDSPSLAQRPSSALLRREIERLLPVAKNKHRAGIIGQQKSELAVVLFEAQRTKAFLQWKVDSLGAFVSAAGMKRDVFAKYKGAGKALLESRPEEYDSLLRAVAEGGPRPALLGVSKLSFTSSLNKQSVTQQAPAVADLVRQRRAPLKMLRTATREMSYGGADERGVQTLSELDTFLRSADRIANLLQAVGAGDAGNIPNELLERRALSLTKRCAQLYDLAEGVRQQGTLGKS